MKKVKSSNISHIGYDSKVLSIKFNNGDTYHYADIPESTYNDLMNAESIGTHFISKIKSIYKGIKGKK